MGKESRRRYIRRYAIAVAFAVPLACVSSAASTLPTTAPTPSTYASGTDTVTPVAVHMPRPGTVTHRLRSVHEERLQVASPPRASWTPVDLTTLDIPEAALRA